MTRRLTRIIPGAAALLAATALGACSGGSDAPDAPVNDNDNAAVVIDETPVQNFAEPEPTPTPTPTPTPVVQDDRGTDEQVQDDADAVGMTARLPREQGGNETAPAE